MEIHLNKIIAMLYNIQKIFLIVTSLTTSFFSSIVSIPIIRASILVIPDFIIVIPAKAGIHTSSSWSEMDPRLRGDDNNKSGDDKNRSRDNKNRSGGDKGVQWDD